MQQIEQASQPASKALLAIDAASHNLQGRVQGLAHEMGSPGSSALGALGPYGLAATAGLTSTLDTRFADTALIDAATNWLLLFCLNG